jgi:hypothetical protein
VGIDQAFSIVQGMISYRFDGRRKEAGKSEEEAKDFKIHVAKILPLLEGITADLLVEDNQVLQATLHCHRVDELAHQIYRVSI